MDSSTLLDIYLQIFHVVVQTVSNQNSVFRNQWQKYFLYILDPGLDWIQVLFSDTGKSELGNNYKFIQVNFGEHYGIVWNLLGIIVRYHFFGFDEWFVNHVSVVVNDANFRSLHSLGGVHHFAINCKDFFNLWPSRFGTDEVFRIKLLKNVMRCSLATDASIFPITARVSTFTYNKKSIK